MKHIYQILLAAMVLLAAPTGLTAQNNLNPIQNEDGLYGFKDQDNKVVIPCQWIHAGLFSEGLAPVMDDNDKYGYINNTGKLVIPCKWSDTMYFSEGLAPVQDENGKWGFIDKKGRVIIPCKWIHAFFSTMDWLQP